MDRALYASATGMAAQQQNLDTIAANLANSDVTGFKGSVEAFAELTAPQESGLGTVSLGSHILFTQGKLAKSGGAFDLAIDGPGFLAVTDAQGRLGYTRGGAFSRAADGSVRDMQGNRLRGVTIPAGALSVTVTQDGVVRATFANSVRTIGKIRITEFPAPDRLKSVGGTFFEATPDCGSPRLVVPGIEGRTSTTLWDARTVKRFHHRRDDANSQRATGVRSQRKGCPGGRRDAADRQQPPAWIAKALPADGFSHDG